MPPRFRGRSTSAIDRCRLMITVGDRIGLVAAGCPWLSGYGVLSMAEERGELLTMRERMEGVGRTPSEAIAFYSAVADVEDRKRAAKLERQFREWRQRENDAASADMTPPSEIDLAELQVMQQRAQRFREREYDRQLTRRQVAADRAAERAAARRRWGF